MISLKVLLRRAAGLCFVLLAALAAGAQAAPKPEPAAEAAILVEASTGRVLFEKNADGVCYPASLTKMMTCILALENGRPDDRIVISNRATDTPYSELQFSTGDILPLREILEGMMLLSDNAAATAVAENLADNYAEFIGLMNKKGQEIGLRHTHFANPHGLTEDDHYSTARDMMEIARWGWQYPDFREITSMKTELVEWAKPARRSYLAENTNVLLESYPGMLGIKTGWTSDAGGCLAAAASRDGVTLITVVLGTEYSSERFADTVKLMDYGFGLVRKARGPVKERLGKKLSVSGSRKAKIMAYPAFDICYPLRLGEQKEDFSLSYKLPDSVPAPIKKNQKVGELVIYCKGKEIGRMPMLAAEDAEKGFSLVACAEGICDTILNLFC